MNRSPGRVCADRDDENQDWLLCGPHKNPKETLIKFKSHGMGGGKGPSSHQLSG